MFYSSVLAILNYLQFLECIGLFDVPAFAHSIFSAKKPSLLSSNMSSTCPLILDSHVSSSRRPFLINPSIIKLVVPYELPYIAVLYWGYLFCLFPQLSCEILESINWIEFSSVFRTQNMAWLEELIS